MQVAGQQQSDWEKSCICYNAPYHRLVTEKELGMDERYAEVSLQSCPECGQLWLRYYYVIEAFTASGRWYLGAITEKQLSNLTTQNAKATLEGLDWYFYGGSYYNGHTGRSSGLILL